MAAASSTGETYNPFKRQRSTAFTPFHNGCLQKAGVAWKCEHWKKLNREKRCDSCCLPSGRLGRDSEHLFSLLQPLLISGKPQIPRLERASLSLLHTFLALKKVAVFNFFLLSLLPGLGLGRGSEKKVLSLACLSPPPLTSPQQPPVIDITTIISCPRSHSSHWRIWTDTH